VGKGKKNSAGKTNAMEVKTGRKKEDQDGPEHTQGVEGHHMSSLDLNNQT